MASVLLGGFYFRIDLLEHSATLLSLELSPQVAESNLLSKLVDGLVDDLVDIARSSTTRFRCVFHPASQSIRYRG